MKKDFGSQNPRATVQFHRSDRKAWNYLTVYITQEMRGRDLTDAMAFGDLEILLPAGEQAAYSTQPTVRKLNRKLVNFSDTDYLLLSGDPVAIGIAAALAAKHNRGRFKVLKWDRQDGKYYPLEINLNPGGTTSNGL